MALLVFISEGQTHSVDLTLEKDVSTYLSFEEHHGGWSSSNEVVQESPFQIIRADNGFYALVPAKKQEVKVNDARIFGLRVLRNTDRIQVGEAELSFYEWVRQQITANSKLLNVPCPFCSVPFNVDDQVILCPKCDTPLHDACWETRRDVNEGCVVPNCGFMVPQEDAYVPKIDAQKR